MDTISLCTLWMPLMFSILVLMFSMLVWYREPPPLVPEVRAYKETVFTEIKGTKKKLCANSSSRGTVQYMLPLMLHFYFLYNTALSGVFSFSKGYTGISRHLHMQPLILQFSILVQDGPFWRVIFICLYIYLVSVSRHCLGSLAQRQQRRHAILTP
jgi:hypothetical protein